MENNRKLEISVILTITLTYLFLFLLIKFLTRLSGILLFAIYSILSTVFVILQLTLTVFYKPFQDVGYRPTLSVVIPAKNEETNIKITIEAVLDSNYPRDRFEVIVVDDGSTDRTAEIVRNIRGVKLIQLDRNYGKRVALATGISNSKGEIIVCIDSDSIVDREALKYIVQPFSNNEIYGVCGHGNVYNRYENILTKMQYAWYQGMFRITKGMESIFGMVTCCSGILSAFRKEGITLIIQDWLSEKFAGREYKIGDDRQLTNFILGLKKKIVWRSEGDDRSLTLASLKVASLKDTKTFYQSNAITYTIVPCAFKKFLKQQLRWKRSWLRCSIYACSIFSRKPFPQHILYYIYFFLTLLTPVIVIRNLIIAPLIGEYLLTISYIIGLLSIHFIHGLNTYHYLRGDFTFKDIFNRTQFVFLTLFLTLVVQPFAWLTIHKGGWVTR